MNPALLAAGACLSAGVCASAALHRAARERVRERAGVRAEAPARGRSSRRRRRAAAATIVGAAAWVGWLLAAVPGAVAASLLAIVAPTVVARRREDRRRAMLEDQLADAADAIASALRAGASIPVAIERTANEVAEPLAGSLRRLADRSMLGVPLVSSLSGWVAETPTPGSRLLASVLGLHHRIGGDAASVLERLARILRERADAAREVRSLTAQARLSGTILGILPIAFFLFLVVTSRQDMSAAYRSPVGATAIAAGLGMQGIAFVWIKRLLRVDA